MNDYPRSPPEPATAPKAVVVNLCSDCLRDKGRLEDANIVLNLLLEPSPRVFGSQTNASTSLRWAVPTSQTTSLVQSFILLPRLPLEA